MSSPSLIFLLFISCVSVITSDPLNFTSISFDQGYTNLWGYQNLIRSSDGNSASLRLDNSSGAGFISRYAYRHGFFSANIKLPSNNYTAGIVVTFYASNVDKFPQTHDEIDFEFLGNTRGKPWNFQTNVYGNGSVSRGREERYTLWFDPSQEFHQYSILWTNKTIVFYIDDIPVREVAQMDEMRGDYPTKPMSVYATIWDGSDWATSGGQYRVNYSVAPFVAEYSEFILQGCAVVVGEPNCSETEAQLELTSYAVVTPEQRMAMSIFRQEYMFYSHCYDTVRYPVPLPDCFPIPDEQRRFTETGTLKLKSSSTRRHKRRSSVPPPRRQKHT